MPQGTPTDVIGRDIEARLEEFSRKRKRDKRKAFALKMGAAILGAAITILLGLEVPAEFATTLKNAALVAGAVVAVLNAWDAFYDHRALWVKRTLTVARLKKLDLEFRVARAARPELDRGEIDRFREALDQIVDDDLSSWVQLRSDTSEKTPRASTAAEAADG